MDMVALENLAGTGGAAEFLGITKGQLRRLTRKDLVPGAAKVAGRYVYDLEALEGWEVPASAAGRPTRRADGRMKYGIYLLPSEAEELAANGYSVIDRAAKREARRAAKAAVDRGEATKEEGETWYDVHERLFGEKVAAVVEPGAEGEAEESAADPFEDF